MQRKLTSKGYLQSYENFECIINTPLGPSKSSNHDNTKRKTTGEETPHAKLLNSLHNQMYISNNMGDIQVMKWRDQPKIKVLTSPTVAPLALFKKETRLSAG